MDKLAPGVALLTDGIPESLLENEETLLWLSNPLSYRYLHEETWLSTTRDRACVEIDKTQMRRYICCSVLHKKAPAASGGPGQKLYLRRRWWVSPHDRPRQRDTGAVYMKSIYAGEYSIAYDGK